MRTVVLSGRAKINMTRSKTARYSNTVTVQESNSAVKTVTVASGSNDKTLVVTGVYTGQTGVYAIVKTYRCSDDKPCPGDVECIPDVKIEKKEGEPKTGTLTCECP